MNPISHKQARGWLQCQIDGQINDAQAAALSEHLQGCAACQSFAAQLNHLDSELRQGYRARARQTATSRIPLPDSAISTLQKNMRLKMKTRQAMNFATSIAFITAMAALAIGLSWLISIQNRINLPGVQSKPLPTATATPFPWTKDAPLTDREQIMSMLETLAQKNIVAFQQAGWVHITRADPGQAGAILATRSDGWYQYPKDNLQACIKSMEVVTQEADSAPLQIIVSNPDGASGDLIQLRGGNGAVTHLKPGDDGCALKTEFTNAGRLIARLKEEQAAGSTPKMDLRAWYETAQGRVEFVVAATFTAPSKDNPTGINKGVQRFDIENGLMTETSTRMEWQDGKLFGETAAGYETELLPTPPDKIASQLEQYSSELQTYANGSVPMPTATATLSGEPVIVVEDQQYISPTKPLTDGQTILQILDALERLQIRRLSQPGWYIYGPTNPSADDWMSNFYHLVHTIDPSGSCDYMSYYIKDGKILPQEIMLADGRWGLISPVENGQLAAGEKGKINWDNGPMSATCQIPNVETISYLHNEALAFKDIVDGKTKGTYKGWTEEIHWRKFFVLYSDIEMNGHGTVMDPQTRKLEPIKHQESWLYFDLNWGSVIEDASVQVFHLQNGQTIGAAPSSGKTIGADFTYYKELPDDLKAAFDKVKTELEALYPQN